ncbi:hypothetical protein [Oricola sp.]|uniref:hypothetical protein n=1 Tax=Oricola sp. TaxID=1979950 RepID=UPI0025E14699|nr:hypothetical protein [Oricola sp.]MCI5073422.1 hypothetical protein [Oricola sp.]
MDKVKITQKSGVDDEWTEFSTRACRGRSGEATWRIEMHVENYRHRYGNKRDTTHLNYLTMSIEEATALRDNLTKAIEAAKIAQVAA